MTVKAVPYFSFPGTAREAMEFYHSIFGGELSAGTFGESGAVPEGDPAYDLMMHTSITGGALDLGASDHDDRFCNGESYSVGNHLMASVWGDDAEEARRIFEALAEGGTVEVPFEKQVWGDHFGQLTDKFGQQWGIDAS